MTKEERREYYQAWRARHPGYHKAWREKYRITAAETTTTSNTLTNEGYPKKPPCPNSHVNK